MNKINKNKGSITWNSIFNWKSLATVLILISSVIIGASAFDGQTKANNDPNVFDFAYTGSQELFIVPESGLYTIEAWGAQGGSRGTGIGGKGGFTSGEVYLAKDDEIYINVGGMGDHVSKGYNGGGKSAHTGNATYGGGASDIRVGGDSLMNRILVAGGGGAGSIRFNGGFGGGVIGGNGNGNATYQGSGGTQTNSSGHITGGFGLGGNGRLYSSDTYYDNGGGGGGGGWFGGGGAYEYGNYGTSGGGGSSYAYTDTSTKIPSYKPDTKYYLNRVVLASGNQSFFSPEGTRVNGRENDGYVRLTLNNSTTSNSADLKDIKINGVSIDNFDSKAYVYNVVIDGTYSARDEITVEKNHTNQSVDGVGFITHDTGNKTQIIRVFSPDSQVSRDYFINFIREKTTKLKSLDFNGYLFKDEIVFNHDQLEYDLDVFQYQELIANIKPFDHSASVIVEGAENISKGLNIVKVNVQVDGIQDTTYKINVMSSFSLDFGFKAREQVFVVPHTGKYKIETWGAQGGSRSGNGTGGLGGYMSGEVNLTKGEDIYIYVGGEGNHISQGFNGGGKSAHSGNSTYGGGASDIRVGGNTFFNRILVAGGGGASSVNNDGGDGGGVNGFDGKGNSTYQGFGATQSSSKGHINGGFGMGGAGKLYTSGTYYDNGAGGGGGGWYGGGGAYEYGLYHTSGGGGSGYAFTNKSYKPSTYNPDSKYYLSNVSDGSIGDKDLNTWEQSFIDVDGKRVSGHAGDGHIRLTYMDEDFKSSAQLQDIKINDVSIPNFDPSVLDYTIEIDADYTGSDEIVVTKTLGNQIVTGTGKITFKTGDYLHSIVVISEDSTQTQTYTLNFVRSNSSKLFNLEVDGFLYRDEVLFQDDIYVYEVDTFQDDEIKINYETYNSNSQVTILGLDNLKKGKNEVKVIVTTPGVTDVTYTINIYRSASLNYSFKNRPQLFTVPYTGEYKFEAWGAQGGSRGTSSSGKGGLGGFSSGVVNLTEGEEVYLFVGGEGNHISQGFNGGGKSAHSGNSTYGGGASDIRIGGNGYYNRILVAGGGGAASVNNDGGNGGGLDGFNGRGNTTYQGLGASQSASKGHVIGGFGFGGVGRLYTSGTYYDNGGGGGGGGWYGGGGAYEYGLYHTSGGGGSGYILSSNSYKPANYSPDRKYYMTDISDGSIGDKDLNTWEQSFIDVDGQRVNGHEGNGHIRITYNSNNILNSTEVNDIKINGVSIPNFKPEQREYTIEIEGEYTVDQEFVITKRHNDQSTVGSGTLKLTHHDQTKTITVVSADKSTQDDYIIHFVRKATSKLAYLSVDEYVHSFTENFKYDKYTYDLSSYVYGGVEVKVTTFDKNATFQVIGAKETELRPGNNKIIVIVSSPGVQDTTYEINAYRQRDIEFAYSGKIEKFSIPYTGIYKFEAWGAQGGTRANTSGGNGGKGGYSSGEIYLKKGEIIYINVGGEGNSTTKGYNGGGLSAHSGAKTYGGGSTDIRVSGEGLYNRILVAGGGGGSSVANDGGHGGGELGGDGKGNVTYQGFGGTQSASKGHVIGGFGLGGAGRLYTSGDYYDNGGGGGGGGWYGGGGAYEYDLYNTSGGGGSSYVYTSSSFKPANYSPSTKYFMDNPVMIPGNQEMPGKDGFTVTGNEGNGFVRISLLNLYGVDSSLAYLNFSEGTPNKSFDPDVLEYDVVLDPEITEIVISADTTDHNASVAWDSSKVLTVMPGVTRYELVVTAQDGSTRVYIVRLHRTASDYSYLDDLTVDGDTILDFEPSRMNYNLYLTYDQARNVEFDWVSARPDQIITGDKSVVLENGVPVKITVISENGNFTSEYIITPIIEDSNLLRVLDIDEATIDFDPNTFVYDFSVSSGISSLNITAIPYDHEAVVTMEGNGYLRNGLNVVTITVTEPNTPVQVYTLNVDRSDTADGSTDVEYDYIYKGEVEYFEAPYTGNYKLEAWGAEGGSRSSAASGGKGGYSTGIVRLTQGEIVAIYVGGAGTSIHKGFNGGGLSGTPNVYGGGASDIRVGNYGLFDRILVAGGGGSVGASNKVGAAGGGLNGLNNTSSYGSGGQGGTQQTAGIRGSFGIGGDGLFANGGRTGAGGGGWYGGGGSTPDYASDDDRGGGGGSSYMFTEDSFKPDGYNVDSKYYLSDTETIAGNAQLPNKDGGYVVGNSGNGFVRITSLRRASTDNNLERIELDNGAILEPEFDTEELNYTINLGVDQTDITIKGVPMDPSATILGNGNYEVPTPGITVDLVVTSESGDVKTYTVRVNRPSSNNSLPHNIAISGLVPSLCDISDDYCNLDPVFDSNDSIENAGGIYYLIVPARIRSLEFSVIKGHEYQNHIGTGIVDLEPGDDNVVYIEVESEDGTSFSSYIFNITRDMTGNADLDYINIDYPSRDLEFSPDITEYYFSVPNEIEHTDDMDWSYATMDPYSNVIEEGLGELSLGSNEIKFTVVANNGMTKEYKLFIYREDSSNTFLSRLIVTHDNNALLIAPSFNKVLHDYVLTVDNEVSEVTIIAEAEAIDTTTVENGVDGVHELNVGQNDIVITLTAEDGSVATYNISIIRKPSNNAMIESISILGEKVESFDPASLNQIIEVESQVLRPELEIKLDNAFASYTINGSYRVFEKGHNTVHVRVTAEDGSIRNYTIIFNKAISDDSTLESVTSTLFDINADFDKDITEYDINIPYSEVQMMISAVPTHQTSKVLGVGGYYLSSGMNIVKLEVVAEDNTSTTYTFKINMLKNTNAELKELSTSVGEFDPVFNSKVTDYAINVPNEVDKFTVSGIPEISSTIVDGLGEYVLNTGLNSIKINTKAESGKTMTYTLNVVRDVSSNADLSYLIVHEGALNRTFMPGIIEYDLSVPAKTSRLTIEASVQDPFATFTILNATNLRPGNNTVIIRVTPQDKIGVKDYTLNVYVQDEASENINLTNLKVYPGKLSPDFLPTRPFYRVPVPNDVTSINVEGFVPAGTEIIGNGDYTLDVGLNLIVVRTKAVNGVTKDYQVEVNRAPSSDARLSSFGVSGHNSSMYFNPNTYNYSTTTFRTSLGFKPVTVHPKATFEIIGNHDFVTGSKTVIVIRVTAEDGITVQDYLIEVHKYASRNNNLKSLSVSGIHFTPEFKPSITTYKAQADENTTQVIVTAFTEDVNAKIEMEKTHELKFGKNFIDIVVVAEDGGRRKYTVEINKAGSRIRDLNTLSVDGVEVPDFHKDTLSYDYDFVYEKESIFIDYELADSKASITGVGEVELSVGMNNLPVVVTSEHGDVKTYTLNVMRRPINSAEIESLVIDQYPIDNGFNPSVDNYNLVIDNEFDSLRFNISLKDKNAQFQIIGNSNLVVGNNIIRIKVTSSEGDKEKIYTFNVYKQEYGNNTLAYLEVDKEKLNPSFYGGQMVYEVDLSYEIDEITFTGETTEASATVSNLGTKKLEYGINHFKFPVKANNQVTRTYHVFVNRSRSNDNYINTMRIEAGGKVYEYSPSFDPKVNEYTLKENVAPGTEAINLILTSNVDGVSGTHRIPISLGDNSIEYVVTSDSGIKNTYVINLHRPASSNNMLTNIVPSSGGLAPNFIYTESEYRLNVDTTTTTLAFAVTTEDRNAVVTGHDRQLVDVGETERVITVKAENGDVKEYVISVNKSDTNNALLDELSVKGYEFKQNFDSHVYSYDLVVPNSKKTIHASEILYKTTDPSAQKNVVLTGSLNLLTGNIPNVYEIRVTAVDGFTSETYRINIIRESSSEAVIKNLAFSQGTLNKNFNSYIYEYDLEFGSDARHFNKNMISRLELTDSSAKVTYSHDSNIELKEGEVTPFTITVTSEDGSVVKEYVFNITYVRSRDNRLANIEINDAQFTPEFHPDILEYDIGVHEDVTAIIMKAFPRDPKAKLLSVVGEQELVNHTTTFEIKVQAENGDIATYKLNVSRSLSESLDLKDIALTDAQGAVLKPEFDNFLSQYEATVPKELTHVGLIVVKGHDSQQITLFDKFNNAVDLNKFDLAIGRNDFRLEVRSPFDDVRIINFRIIRDGNSNNYLSDLNVTDPTVDIEFDRDKMEYFMEVENMYDSITLNYEVEDPTAKVNVLNNIAFREGNNDVIVRVTAENGDVRNYVIHVFRKAKFDNFLQNIVVSVGGKVISEDPKFFTPNFHRGTMTYVVEVGASTDIATVQGVAPEGSIVTGSSTSPSIAAERGVSVTLNPGNNIVKLMSMDQSGESTLIYTINIIKKMSDDVSLKSLLLESGGIMLDYEEGEFDPDRNFYTTSVDSDTNEVRVTAVALNPNARVEVVGHENLLNGENLVKVSVTSEDRTKTKVYTVLVKKNLSGDNTLTSLNITDSNKPVTELDLSKEELVYRVGKDVDTVVVDGVLSDPMADVNGLGTHSVIHGENKVNITIKAQNGDIKIYTITVIREYDNALESLRVSQGELSPEFDSEHFEYTVWVPLAVDRINIEGIAKNAPIAQVTGNGWYDLTIGSDNLFTISVQSSVDDVASETTIKVIRSASPNTNISILDIEQGLISPDFDSQLFEYDTYIKDSNNSVDLIIVPEDPKATYEIIDNPNVTVNPSDKNKVNISQIVDDLTEITIRVTAENGDTKDTVLRIHRQPAALFSNLLSSLEVNPVKNLSPVFRPTTNNYIAIVDVDIKFITIKATKQSPEATIVSGTGTFAVEPGRNTYNIVVRSKDGVDNIYKVVINQAVSADATLSNLVFDEGFLTPIFSRATKNYSINVGASVNFLTPEITPYANGTTWTIEGPGISQDLQMGENTPIEINTTAANGVGKDKYTVKVNKTNQTSVYLRELSSNIGTFHKPFDKYQEGPYRLEIDANVNSVILSGRAEEPQSVASIQGLGVVDMSQANNKTVEVIVLGKAGNKMTYYVEIVKALNDDVKLSYLAVNPGTLTPIFNPNQSLYNVKVDSHVDTIEILANTTGQATITGTGVKPLVTGDNTFTVTLTTNLGSVGVYTIVVEREAVQSAKVLELRFNEALIETPFFHKDDTNYQLYVPYEVEELTLNHILLEDPNNAEYEIVQTPFIVGDNTVEINVTNKVSGDTMTYTFNVTRYQFSSNYLTSLSTDKGLLTPAFDKLHNYYELDVPYETTEITTIGTVEDGLASVSGIGPHRDLEVGVNEIKVTVTSVTGVPRVYIVRVNRLLDSRKELLTLNVEGGTLSPAFGNSQFREYTVNVPEDKNQVTFTGTISPNATVTGLETVMITSPEMNHEIIVTAQDGSIQTYKFTIRKQLSPDANVISITPSDGDLDPNFDPTITDYEVIVQDDIHRVGFDVVTSNSFAVVTGNEEKQLQYGDNIFTIRVVSENGLQSNEYEINVIRLKDIQSLSIDPQNHVMNVNDTFQLTLNITPTDATNTDVTWTSDNDDIVSVDDNGLITGNKVGNAVITAHSTKNPNIKATMVVEVLNLKIESDVLDIVRDTLTETDIKDYVIGSELITVDEFTDLFINEKTTLFVFDSNGVQISDDSLDISTKYTIQLIVNGTVYDELIIIVRGDVNGDSVIDLDDAKAVSDHSRYIITLDEIEFLAADVVRDSIVDLDDSKKISDFVRYIIDSLND